MLVFSSHALLIWAWSVSVCLSYYRCCGSMTFWYGSGSVDLYHCLTDPGIFVSDLHDDNSKKKFYIFLLITYFLKLHLHMIFQR
jgi:hypothetical protein